MLKLRNPDIILKNEEIITERLLLSPFALHKVNVLEVWQEFCMANRNLFIAPENPETIEQEISFLKLFERKNELHEAFQLFIFEKANHRFIGCIGIRVLENDEYNLWIWIRTDEQRKWFATEAYRALIDWSKKNLDTPYLKHSLNEDNICSQRLVEKFSGILQKERTKERDHLKYFIYL